MKLQLTFVVDGQPCALARPGIGVVSRGGKQRAHAYDPDKNKVAKAHVGLVAGLAMRDGKVGGLLKGPLEMRVIFWRLRPVSKQIKDPGRLTEENLLKKSYPITTPDLDNMLKLVCDACEGIVYKNDSQIVQALAYKRYSDKPRTEVIIRCLGMKDMIIALWRGLRRKVTHG